MTAHADTALELLDYIDRSGGQVWLEGERMRYRLPGGHTATLERLSKSRDAVRAVLLSRKPKRRPAQTPTSATLEPLTVWAALHASIPECLEIIRSDGHLIAWLEYRTPSQYWVSTPPVTADRDTLERLVLTVAARNQDALNAALKSARGLNPDVNPARQEVAQRARFSRREVNA